MTLRELLTKGEDILRGAAKDNPRFDARALYKFMKNIDDAGLLMAQRDQVSPEDAEEYLNLISRRAEGVPLQHITGCQGFMGLNFRVSPAVLIPRPETEVLVEEAMGILRENFGDGTGPVPEVLDLCTGSGAIGISVKKYCPQAKVTLSDISEEALEIAQLNAELNCCSVETVQSDMFSKLEGMTFDMILCNPPYISDQELETLATEVRDHDPRMALAGGPDGLDFYRILAGEAGAHLAPGGWLLMEIGYDQGETVPELMKGLGEARVLRDLNGLSRVVVVRKKLLQ